MKVCTQCHKEKQEDQFAKSKRGKGGLRSYCKECENKYMKNYYNQRPQGRFYRLQSNARKDGVLIEMTKDDFVTWFNTQELKCLYCETKLEFVYGRHWQWNGLTLDRLDPTGSYSIGNIALCCRRCNIIKGHWFSKDQMIAIATKYLRS